MRERYAVRDMMQLQDVVSSDLIVRLERYHNRGSLGDDGVKARSDDGRNDRARSTDGGGRRGRSSGLLLPRVRWTAGGAPRRCSHVTGHLAIYSDIERDFFFNVRGPERVLNAEPIDG